MDERRRTRPDWRRSEKNSDEEEFTPRWTNPRREAVKFYQNMRDLDHKDYTVHTLHTQLMARPRTAKLLNTSL